MKDTKLVFQQNKNNFKLKKLQMEIELKKLDEIGAK